MKSKDEGIVVKETSREAFIRKGGTGEQYDAMVAEAEEADRRQREGIKMGELASLALMRQQLGQQ